MLTAENLHFSYQNNKVLNNISFNIPQGAHVCIIGESGCGKSTLLKAIYGLLDLDEGKLFWKEKQILGPAYNLIPGEAYMKFLTQENSLMPYISVLENIKKFLSRQQATQSDDRAHELLAVIDMEAYANTKVKFLSGGQKQRVALAQVLAKLPEVLLLDEPFNFIDNFKKNNLRRNVFRYLKNNNITCVFATHDSTDMLGFADKALVMKEGGIITSTTPEQLYNNPPNYYTASLLGEVNKIPLSYFEQANASKKHVLLYPFEIKETSNGFITGQVIKSYFIGENYLIEVLLTRGEVILITSQVSYNKQEEIALYVEEGLWKKRVR